MMNSLEVRTPLIDLSIINLMSKIPSKHKISRNFNGSWQKKKVLNAIAKKRFGNEFVERKKRGFVAPIEDWFEKTTPLGKEIDAIIKSNKSKIYDYLDFEEVNSLFYKTKTPNFNMKYQFFVLEKWLISNI